MGRNDKNRLMEISHFALMFAAHMLLDLLGDEKYQCDMMVDQLQASLTSVIGRFESDHFCFLNTRGRGSVCQVMPLPTGELLKLQEFNLKSCCLGYMSWKQLETLRWKISGAAFISFIRFESKQKVQINSTKTLNKCFYSLSSNNHNQVKNLHVGAHSFYNSSRKNTPDL